MKRKEGKYRTKGSDNYHSKLPSVRIHPKIIGRDSLIVINVHSTFRAGGRSLEWCMTKEDAGLQRGDGCSRLKKGGNRGCNARLLRVLSRPGGCKAQPRAANSCKEFADGLSRLVVVRVLAIYPEQRPPLTTIYREPRRCVINSSARARNFKTFQASLFFHFHGESPFRTLLVSRPSLSLSPLPNEGHGGRERRGAGLLRGFAAWLISD